MLSLWQMSLSASAVILLTALLRRLTGPRLPRRMYIALWDVALLCCLIPFRVTWEALSRRVADRAASVSAALTHIPARTAELSAVATEAVPTAILPGTALPAVGGMRHSLNQATLTLRETAQSAPDWLWPLLVALWGVGAALLAAVLLHRWLVCHRAFAEALPCEDQRAEAFLRAHPLRRRVRIRVSAHIASPLSYGLARPVILLPASLSGADDQTLHYVLTHEFLHIRAWDMLRKSALLLALCLHWPNPLIWLMARLYSRDMELMCDERVLRRLGGRKAYCTTLLDMEVRRSNLTMGTCFSVTGIEERIKVMKNRKHQGILSIMVAFAIFLGAMVGAVTGIPMADAEDASPRLFISRATWDSAYAQYAPYGLGYDEKNGTITFNGQVVRYFEDMWPIDEQGKSGTCFQYEAGAVDVYGVREFPEFIQRNPDGSFDPSGTLVGLREATKEEYDEHTLRMQTAHLHPGTTAQIIDAYQISDATVLNSDDVQYGFAYRSILSASDPDDAQTAIAEPMEVVWWTAEEYRQWLEEERAALQELVDEQAQAWTPSTGWFTWTQEKADEAIARYEDVLRDIEQGALVSRLIDAQEANMTLVQHLGETVFSTAQTDALASETEPPTIVFKVSPQYKTSFTPETWALIEKQIADGTIQWETIPSVTYKTEDDGQAARLEGWRETVAPYAALGLTYALDAKDDTVRLYWNGKEIRGVYDPQQGLWITEHTGLGHYPDGAKELIAVYENGVLISLREADAEESAEWNALRKGH